jgi:hypothetical protein
VFLRCISWRRPKKIIKGAWSFLLCSKCRSKTKNPTSQQDTSQNIPLDKLDDAARNAITRDLQDAAHAGALIAIVRSKSWKPLKGEIERIPGVSTEDNGSIKSKRTEKYAF